MREEKIQKLFQENRDLIHRVSQIERTMEMVGIRRHTRNTNVFTECISLMLNLVQLRKVQAQQTQVVQRYCDENHVKPLKKVIFKLLRAEDQAFIKDLISDDEEETAEPPEEEKQAIDNLLGIESQKADESDPSKPAIASSSGTKSK